MKDIREFLTEASNPMKKYVKIAEESKIGGQNLKKYYHKKFPTDSMWKEMNGEITLAEAFKQFAEGYDIYQITFAHDSIIRERIFDFFCEMTGLEYDKIYYHWLKI